MKAEIKKILTLTKEERETLKRFYEIVNDDNDLNFYGIYALLADIYTPYYDSPRTNYEIKIID